MNTRAKLLILVLALAVIALIAALAWPEENDGFPLPPPGSRYCTNGEQLAFCRDDDSGEWH